MGYEWAHLTEWHWANRVVTVTEREPDSFHGPGLALLHATATYRKFNA